MPIRKIALTGGIATGKTYVADRLRAAGVPIVDADVLAREVVALGTPALAAVRQRFGPDVIRRDGTMDRIRVGQIIFKDKRARQDLEAIIHPAVQKAIDKYFAALPRKTPLAVAMQLQRVMERNQLTKEDAERRLAAQWPIEKKIDKASHVIRTDGTFDETNAQVDALIASFTK